MSILGNAKNPPARRVAFVIHDLNTWGGHDRSTLEIARRVSHFHPVDVYAYTLQDPQGLEAWGDVRFKPIKPHFKRPVFFKISWFFAANLPRLNIIPFIKGEPRPLVHTTGACALGADVIQVQFVNAAWNSKLKVLPPEVCAPPHARGRGKLETRLRKTYQDFMMNYGIYAERELYVKDKNYIAIAHSVAKELEEHFGIRDHVHVIHHGVDSEIFKPAETEGEIRDRAKRRAELKIAAEDVVISFVGAYERKGLAIAIRALAEIKLELRKNVKLLAVGGGSEAGFRELAQSLGVSENVIFVGHQKQIVPYYQIADLFLLPTLYEPFGLVVLEAMACGLAPIVSRIAGASELIKDGESGKLIEDPTDPKEIARLLEPWVENGALRKKAAFHARKVALGRSWDQVAREYSAVFSKLLGTS